MKALPDELLQKLSLMTVANVDENRILKKKYHDYLSDLNKIHLKKPLFEDNRANNCTINSGDICNTGGVGVSGSGGDGVGANSEPIAMHLNNFTDGGDDIKLDNRGKSQKKSMNSYLKNGFSPPTSPPSNNLDLQKNEIKLHTMQIDNTTDQSDMLHNVCHIDSVKMDKSIYVHHYCPMVSALNNNGMVLTVFVQVKVPKQCYGQLSPNMDVLESVEYELHKYGLNGRLVFDRAESILQKKCFKHLVVRLKRIFPQLSL